MNLHQAEFIAGEWIAFNLAVQAILAVWQQYQRQQERPGQTGTTEYSSLNDD